MESKLFSGVDVKAFLQFLLFLFLAGMFVYREWPGFWERVKHRVQGEEMGSSLSSRLDRIEADVKEINEKLNRDYGRINAIEAKMEQDKHVMRDIKAEQGIIMRALLGALGGLQELGANGATEKAKEEIVEYLNRQAHGGDGQ